MYLRRPGGRRAQGCVLGLPWGSAVEYAQGVGGRRSYHKPVGMYWSNDTLPCCVYSPMPKRCEVCVLGQPHTECLLSAAKPIDSDI